MAEAEILSGLEIDQLLTAMDGHWSLGDCYELQATYLLKNKKISLDDLPGQNRSEWICAVAARYQEGALEHCRKTNAQNSSGAKSWEKIHLQTCALPLSNRTPIRPAKKFCEKNHKL